MAKPPPAKVPDQMSLPTRIASAAAGIRSRGVRLTRYPSRSPYGGRRRCQATPRRRSLLCPSFEGESALGFAIITRSLWIYRPVLREAVPQVPAVATSTQSRRTEREEGYRAYCDHGKGREDDHQVVWVPESDLK